MSDSSSSSSSKPEGRNISTVNRTFLAFALAALVFPLGMVAESLGVGSWGGTAIVVAAMLLVSLVDREGFYGPREPPSP
jgi:hypothetical protein